MKDPDNDLRQAVALFRYGVIADLAHLPVGAPGMGAMMRAKAELSYAIPSPRPPCIGFLPARGCSTASRQPTAPTGAASPSATPASCG